MKNLNMKSVIRASLAVGMIALLSTPINVLAEEASKKKSSSETFSGVGGTITGMDGTSRFEVVHRNLGPEGFLVGSKENIEKEGGGGSIGIAVESTHYGRTRREGQNFHSYHLMHGHANLGVLLPSISARGEMVMGITTSDSGLGLQAGAALNGDFSAFSTSGLAKDAFGIDLDGQSGASFTPSARVGLIYDLDDINSFLTLSGVLAAPLLGDFAPEAGANLTVTGKKGFLSLTGTQTLSKDKPTATNVNIALAKTLGDFYVGAYAAVNRRAASKNGFDLTPIAGRTDSNNLVRRTESGFMFGGAF